MSQLILHTGPFRSFYYFNDLILENIRNRRQNFMVILPVNRAVRILKKNLVDHSPNRTLANPLVFTFDELLLNIYRQFSGAKRVISHEITGLLIESILNERKPEFEYLRGGKRISSGMVRKVNEMVAELRRFGYDEQEFQKTDPAARKEQPLKFRDFQILLTSLDQKLGDTLIDEPFAMHQAAKLLTKERFYDLFPGIQSVYIAGYGLFTPAMFEFIRKTSQWSDVHIKLDYKRSNEILFAHTSDAFNRFVKMGAQIEEDDKGSELSNRLFNRDKQVQGKIPNHDRILTLSADDRGDEVALIAGQIRQLHSADNIPLHKIAVTFSNLEKYVPLIRKTFKAYQIPFNLSTGFGLLQSPLIRIFINSLRLIEQRFRFNDCWQYLNSSFINMPDAYNPNLVYKLFIENRYQAMDNNSLTRLKNWLISRKKTRSSESEDIEQQILQLEILEKTLKPYFDFPVTDYPAGFRSAYIKLLKQTGLLNWYNNDESPLTERERENEFRAFNRFIKSFDKLIWTLEYLYKDRQMPLKDFLNYLQAALDRTNYNLTEFPDYGVQIMPRLEIQALDFDVLFIGGLIDGEFPRASAKDIFFSDPIRDKIGLVAAEELLDQDRFIFYSLLDSNAKKIILTHPKFEGDKAIVPSTFLSDLAAVAEVESGVNTDSGKALNPAELLKIIGFDLQLGENEGAREHAEQIVNSGIVETKKLFWTLERIQRSISRVFENHFTSVEGMLDKNEHVHKSLSEMYSNRTWSVTLLEEYAFCPMQFFLDKALKIEDLPSLDEDISSLERGIAVHQILFRFYRELKQKKAADKPAKYPALLKKIAGEVFQQMPFKGMFWDLEQQVYFGSEQSKGLLDVFIDYDQEQIALTGFTPSMFELAFGFTADSDKDETSTNRAVELKSAGGSVRINGKIDRVDTDDKNNTLIFDYKTGIQSASGKISEIIEGTRFQLPLYMLALMKLHREFNAGYAAYYLVKDAENCKRKELLADKETYEFVSGRTDAGLPNKKFVDENGEPMTLNGLLDLSLNHAIRKVDDLQAGIFRHTKFPGNAGCESYCAFRRICQKNVGKIRRINEVKGTN